MLLLWVLHFCRRWTPQLSVPLTVPDGTSRKTYMSEDEVNDPILEIDAVETVGAEQRK